MGDQAHSDDTATASIPADAFALRESSTPSGPVDEEGNVLLHIIRPGLGKGRGSHLYEADMLRENAHKFSNWKMYVNHLSPEARKKQGGLPRDVRDLGGRIIESWWDESVPASGRFGQGAVVGRAKPTPLIRELIENDPEIIEASISATATGVRPGSAEGKRVWVVEGIEDKGSVDWVTEAGAGGRVVSLMEAADEGDPDGWDTLLASMTDDEVGEYVRAHRPELAAQLAEADGGEDSGEAAEEDHMGITAEELSPDLLVEAIEQDERLQEALVGALHALVEARLPGMVAQALEAERDLIRAEARADADRRVELRDMREQAHAKIDESRLPDAFKADLKAKFDISEGTPSEALDVLPDIDDDGNVVKSASEKLAESVEAKLAEATSLVQSVAPTKVRGQGAASDGDQPRTLKGGKADALLQEAGFSDIDKVYDPSRNLDEQ